MQEIQTYAFFNELIQLPFIEQIWLFGSRSRNDWQNRSDIDLAILCPHANDEEWQQIEKIIQQADSLLKIDCIRFDRLAENDAFRHHILKDKQVLYIKGAIIPDWLPWQGTFKNLGNALARFTEVLTHPDLDKIEYLQDAAIHRFEFTIELYWKVLKKILAYEKVTSDSPRDVLSKAYQFQLIDDEKAWLGMLEARNQTSHLYHQAAALQVLYRLKLYLPVLKNTYAKLCQHYRLAESEDKK